jgi:hypothetical protein
VTLDKKYGRFALRSIRASGLRGRMRTYLGVGQFTRSNWTVSRYRDHRKRHVLTGPTALTWPEVAARLPEVLGRTTVVNAD